jgi:hypothetical protein
VNFGRHREGGVHGGTFWKFYALLVLEYCLAMLDWYCNFPKAGVERCDRNMTELSSAFKFV